MVNKKDEYIRVALSPKIQNKITEYRIAHVRNGKIMSESQAVRELVEIGSQWDKAHSKGR